MKIKFNILWFEDAKTWIPGKLKDIKEIVEEEGFELVYPKICKNEQAFNGDFNDYDLILMDYALTEGKHEKTGVNIIEKIRRKNVYTTILFYSRHGEEELREKIAEKQIDGVFCAHRDDFIDEFESIFKIIIKKTQDINNLRGLVMAETSDIDSLKEEIIELYDKTNCAKKKQIKNKIIKTTVKSAKDYLKKLESKNDDTPFTEIVELLDLSKKSKIIHSINNRSKPICGYTYANFYTKIIEKRNLLAHVKEKIVGSGSKKQIVLESKKGKLIFSEEEARKIRTDLSEYKKELETIKRTLIKK